MSVDPREEIEDQDEEPLNSSNIPDDGGEDHADDLSQTTEGDEKAFLDRGLSTK